MDPKKPTDSLDSLPKIQWVTQSLLEQVSGQAKASQRQRMNFNLHRLEDRVQRMLNAMEPGTYVRPHRHIDPPKTETFVCLRGQLGALFFDDAGCVTETLILSPHGICIVDIPAGRWHSLLSLEAGTIVFEAKDGPYVPATDKLFASWAPAEGDPKAQAYREWMRQHFHGTDR